MTAPTNDRRELLAAVLAEHRWRDVRGDYEVSPYSKHFGCSCGGEWDIAGMSGYWSWVAVHDTHVATALDAALAQEGERGGADPAFIHARWHRALDDPAREEPGPIRDHINQHDAEVLRAAAEMVADANEQGLGLGAAYRSIIREADRIAGDQP